MLSGEIVIKMYRQGIQFQTKFKAGNRVLPGEHMSESVQ